MGRKSKIEWLEGGATWNFLYGCTKVAQGCTHCYAERVVPRLGLRAVGPLARTMEKAWTGGSVGATYHGNVIVREDHLDDPSGWTKPLRVFVNSLSDTFHEDVPNALLDRAFSVMAKASQHTYLLLTKRPERMATYLKTCELGASDTGKAFPWPHVWGGFSFSREDEWRGTEELRSAPLAVRFLSIEPLIGPIDVRGMLDGIHWVIVGGESGRLARPCQEKWVRQIVKACQAAKVPVFVKQMGAWWASELKKTCPPVEVDTKGGDPNLWPDDLRVRRVPRAGRRMEDDTR